MTKQREVHGTSNNNSPTDRGLLACVFFTRYRVTIQISNIVWLIRSGSSPSWWTTTVASYRPSKMLEHSKSNLNLPNWMISLLMDTAVVRVNRFPYWSCVKGVTNWRLQFLTSFLKKNGKSSRRPNSCSAKSERMQIGSCDKNERKLNVKSLQRFLANKPMHRDLIQRI